jgi:CheY-like chemotaxis protein
MSSVAPHILALDDDVDIRKVLTDYLAGQDFRVTAVATGANYSPSSMLNRSTC